MFLYAVKTKPAFHTVVPRIDALDAWVTQQVVGAPAVASTTPGLE